MITFIRQACRFQKQPPAPIFRAVRAGERSADWKMMTGRNLEDYNLPEYVSKRLQPNSTVLLQDCRSCYHMRSIHISCITICRYHCTNVSSAFLMSLCPFCILQQSESLRKQHTSPSSSSTTLGSRGHHLPPLLSAVFVRVFFFLLIQT